MYTNVIIKQKPLNISYMNDNTIDAIYSKKPKTQGNFSSKKKDSKTDIEIVFNKQIRSGRRVYYIDAKKTRRGELYLSITESVKQENHGGDPSQFQFEKHKIFLFEEDFTDFTDCLQEVIEFIKVNAKSEAIEDSEI